MPSLSSLLKHSGRFISNNSPTILTVIGVTGTLATAYLAGDASFKAARLIDETETHEARTLSVNEKIKLTWKLYIPAAATATFTVSAIVGSNRISTRRATSLATAMALSDKAFEEYRQKVLDKMGEKKEQAVRDEIAQDRVDRNPESLSTVIINADASVVCYDSYTGRYFMSDMETIRKAANDINQQIIQDHYASLSDFCFLIGLPSTGVTDEVGWNLDKFLEVHFSATITDLGKVCMVIDYEVSPARSNFRSL